MRYNNSKREKKDQMKALIQSALMRYDAGELLEMLSSEIEKDATEKNNLQYSMDKLCSLQGAFVIRCQNLKQYMEIENFITSTIYPTYNEQQAFLNF